MSVSPPSFSSLFQGFIRESISVLGLTGSSHGLLDVQFCYKQIEGWAKNHQDSLTLNKGRKKEAVWATLYYIFYSWSMHFGLFEEKRCVYRIGSQVLCDGLMSVQTITLKDLSKSTKYKEYMSFLAAIYLANRYDQTNRVMLEKYDFMDVVLVNRAIYGERGDPLLNEFIHEIKKMADFYLNGYERYSKVYGLEKPLSPLDKMFFIEELMLFTDLISDEMTFEQRALEKIKSMSPKQFELFSLELMVRVFDGDESHATHYGQSHDGGIDGVVQIRNRFNSLDPHYVQCKRYTEKTVGSPEVQGFAGAMDSHGTTMGIFITTSKFSSNAKEFVKKIRNKKIQLIDGDDLVEMMKEHKIGIEEVCAKPTLKMDNMFFDKYKD